MKFLHLIPIMNISYSMASVFFYLSSSSHRDVLNRTVYLKMQLEFGRIEYQKKEGLKPVHAGFLRDFAEIFNFFLYLGKPIQMYEFSCIIHCSYYIEYWKVFLVSDITSNYRCRMPVILLNFGR